MGLAQRRRWRTRLVLLAAVLVTVFAVSWLVRPAGAALTAFTRRLVTVSGRIEPVLVAEYFLLQSVTCQQRAGFRCAPMTLPDGRGFVSRRPSIVPANAISRSEARKEIADGLGSASAWLRAFAAAPGAAIFTTRYVNSHGWEAGVMLALSLAVAMTLLFWLVDSVVVCVVLTPVVAIGVSWLIAAIVQALLSSGWQAPFGFLVTVVVVAAGCARDLFERSATFERIVEWRWKRRLANASVDD
jgi:hypothetical protein